MSAPSETPRQWLERSWHDGTRPDLDALLDANPVPTPEELIDLLCIDQKESWRSGERRPAESYLHQCPILREHPELFLDLVRQEIHLRELRGEQPTLGEYRERFPDLAPRLQRQFASHPSVDPARGIEQEAYCSPSHHALPDEAVSRTLDRPKGHDNGRPAAGATRWLGPPAAKPAHGLESCDSVDLLAIPRSLHKVGESSASLAPKSAGAEGPFVGPEVIGYEVLGELGRGGMGVVFLARQKGLNRPVALKMMLSGNLAELSNFERFRAEAATLGRLQHPGIIQIYEIGDHQGQPFFSLEYAAGGSLDSKVRGSPQSPAVAAELVEGLARAMQAAHQAGVIHRDLKPANILLSPLGADSQETGFPTITSSNQRDGALDLKRWHPKITDFGLAKCVGDESGQTRSGDVLGTPSYMAPEQASGKIQEIGPCSDIYALGAILYELLTGRPPFRGENAWDTIAQVVEADPVPPRRLQPKVPRDLETICLKCLEKAPARRYRRADELAGDLQRFREGRPIQARPVSVIGRGWKLVKRRPLVSTLLLLVALGLGGSGMLAVENLRKEKQLAEQGIEQLRRSEAERDQVRDMLHDAEGAAAAQRWRDAEALLAPARSLIAGNADLTEYRARADQLHAQVTGFGRAADTLQRFTAHCEEAHFYQSQMTGLNFAANVAMTRTAARAALALFGMGEKGRREPAIGSHYNAGEKQKIAAGCYEQLLLLAAALAQPLTAEHEDGRKQAGLALALLDRADQMGLPPTRVLHLQRSQALRQQGDASGSEDEMRKAQAIAPTHILDFFLLGLESYRRGDYTEALKQFDQVLAKQEHHFWARYLSGLCHVKKSTPAHALAAVRDLTGCAEQRPDFAWVFLVRGYLHTEAGDFTVAERDFERASTRADTPAARYTLLVNRGVLRLRQRKFTESIADFERAIELQPDRYQARMDLARAYQETKLLELALKEYDAALRCAAAPGADPGPRVLAAAYRSRAALQVQRDRTEEAASDYLEASRKDPRASDHIERGRILLKARQNDKALGALDEALKLQADESTAHHLRALALMELKRPAEALPALDRCLEKGKPTAAICELRGRVKAQLGDHAGAVEDYSQAITLKPRPATYDYRGWAYVILESPRLAQRDFEEVIKREPTSADGHNGRATARVLLGQYRLAVKDAEEAVRLDPSSYRVQYKAARVFALAMSRVEADLREANRKNLVRDYQERSVELLRKAVEGLPMDQRATFWQDQVEHDTALAAIHRSTEFLRLKNLYRKAVR